MCPRRSSGWSAGAAEPMEASGGGSRDPSDAEGGEPGGGGPGSELLFLLEVRHEEAAAFVLEAEVVYRKNPQSQADLGLDRVERRIERLLGDAELGDPHRDHAGG